MSWASGRALLRPALAAAALAAAIGPAPLAAAAATVPTPGLLVNVTLPLAAGYLLTGDVVAAGWTLSVAGPHGDTAVRVTGASATIPLLCVSRSGVTPQTLVVSFPDTAVTVRAGDVGWRPTLSTSSPQSYEATSIVRGGCDPGLLVPHGDVAYRAHVTSAGGAHTVAMRFHAVDGSAPSRRPATAAASRPPHAGAAARAPAHHGRGHSVDCSNPSQNHGGGTCQSPWTSSSSTTTPAPAAAHRPGGAPAPGAGAVAQPPAPPAVAARGHTAAPPQPTAPSAPRRPAPASGDAVPAPVAVVVPAPAASRPASSSVLSPVPVLAPGLGIVSPARGDGWLWLLAIAAIDGLVVVVLMARRRRSTPAAGSPR